MLRLSRATDGAWIERVRGAMDQILLDHAHCEKKAASTAINLIFRYQDKPELLLPLSSLAREELEHFELVVQLMRRRGLEFGRQSPSPYAAELYTAVRKEEPARLIDTLIVCAFIEARSCERMKILAENLEDTELASMYRSLLASEARHHQSYIDLAALWCPRPELEERIAALSAHEAAVIAAAPPLPRMHC